ncbi:hypothetical protein E2X65_08450 [Salmonella enterica]|nr:hypothetical protein [Salmonella enterica]
MKSLVAWSLLFTLSAFSAAALADETPAEAIARLYSPLADNSNEILSTGFIVDLRSNANATKGRITPRLNNRLLCRCQPDAFISAELIETTKLNAGRIHTLLQLALDKNSVDAHRLLGLTLIRDNNTQRWVVEDIDDGAEVPQSLRQQIREDTRIKSQATDSEPNRDVFSGPISMIALLANPEKYHLQKIQVMGVSNIEFEGNALFLDKASWENNIDSNSLWLDIDRNSTINRNSALALNGQYILIEGVFDMDETGHFGAWRGGITHITRYERVPTRTETERQRQETITQLEKLQKKK